MIWLAVSSFKTTVPQDVQTFHRTSTRAGHVCGSSRRVFSRSFSSRRSCRRFERRQLRTAAVDHAHARSPAGPTCTAHRSTTGLLQQEVGRRDASRCRAAPSLFGGGRGRSSDGSCVHDRRCDRPIGFRHLPKRAPGSTQADQTRGRTPCQETVAVTAISR